MQLMSQNGELMMMQTVNLVIISPHDRTQTEPCGLMVTLNTNFETFFLQGVFQ